jgi:hypothetical protein
MNRTALLLWGALCALDGVAGPPASAQARYASHVEISYASMHGIGAGVSGEIGLSSRLRLGIRWLDTQVIASCYESHGPSECGANPSLVEINGRMGLGVGEMVWPFLGAGTGMYRRTWHATRSGGVASPAERGSSPFIGALGGFDIAVAPPLVIRAAVTHVVVLDNELKTVYGRQLRHTVYSVGIGIAKW